jgi:Superinfection immunity protein
VSTISALIMAGLILLVLGVYWLPSIVARIKRHPDLVPIVIVNGLLGWTAVGWVWAVVKLVSGTPGHPSRPHDASRTGFGLALAGGSAGYDTGRVGGSDGPSAPSTPAELR